MHCQQLADPLGRCVTNRIVQQNSIGKRQRIDNYALIESSSYGVGKVEQLPDFFIAKKSILETDQKDITIEKLREGQNLASGKSPFLWKLHILLQDVEKTGDDHIISWLPHGHGFKVYRPKAFITRIAPHYFKQSKYKSFQRQLHLYEFTRTPYGPEAGSYSHPNFIRGSPNSCLTLSPIKIKGKNGRNTRSSMAPPIVGATPSPSASPTPPLSMDTSDCTVSEGPAMFPSKEQSEWLAKIRQMLVNGATLAAQLSQEHEKGGENNPAALLPETDDTCYAFGSAFHIVPLSDPFSCDDCCASDDED